MCLLAEMKKEEPTSGYSTPTPNYDISVSSYNAPHSGYGTSDSSQSWQQQQQSRKRPFDDMKARGYYEHRDDKRCVQASLGGQLCLRLRFLSSEGGLALRDTRGKAFIKKNVVMPIPVWSARNHWFADTFAFVSP